MVVIAKVMVLDREFEKITEDDMKRYMEEYARYCVDTYKWVGGIGISDKDARLSPLQYFLEDKIRLKRLNENRLAAQVSRR
jgi:hypothetical protein